MSLRRVAALVIAFPILLGLPACGPDKEADRAKPASPPVSASPDGTAGHTTGESASPPAAASGASGELIKDGLHVVPGSVWADHAIKTDTLAWTTTLKLTGNPDTVAEAFLRQMLAMGMIKFQDRTSDSTDNGIKVHLHSVGARWANPDGSPKTGADNIDQMSVDVTQSSDGDSRVLVMGQFAP